MIAVIGLGFVGLATGLGLAHISGHKVYGYEKNEKKRAMLKKGEVPFYEPFMEEYLGQYKDNKFIICNSMKEAIENASIIFFCVGTPSKASGEADLQFIKKAIKESLTYMDDTTYRTMVIKSTIPPTTTSEIIKPFIEYEGYKIGKDVGLANNCEFLREGMAWRDFVEPDRIVIGELDQRGADLLESVYKNFDAPIYRVSPSTGEFIKYLSNTLLSTLISFSNEMAMVADTIKDINVSEAFKFIHMDKRWFGTPARMTSYVYPGCGFGGYCLPKDTNAIGYMAEAKGYEPTMIKAVLKVNDKVKLHITQKIINVCDKESRIGILGLSFKPDTDDVRYTPSIDIIRELMKSGYKDIMAYDPLAMGNFDQTYRIPIMYANNLKEVINRCDVIVLLTGYSEFIENKAIFENKKVIDGRYCL